MWRVALLTAGSWVTGKCEWSLSQQKIGFGDVVFDVTERYAKDGIDPSLLHSALLNLPDDEDFTPAYFMFQSRARNVTSGKQPEVWNSVLIDAARLKVPAKDTNVVQIRFRLEESSIGKLVSGLSTARLLGPEFGLTGCLLAPDGNLLSSNLGAARIEFTGPVHGGDVVDWLLEVRPDVTMDVWLMVNGAPRGLAFAVDFAGDAGLLWALKPALAFTSTVLGDKALVVVFPPVSLTDAQLLQQPYRQQVIPPAFPQEPWLGFWDIAASDDDTLKQAREDNVDFVVGVRFDGNGRLLLSCNIVNTQSILVTGDSDHTQSLWTFLIKDRGNYISTQMRSPLSLTIYETACTSILSSVSLLAFQNNVLGIYWSGGSAVFTRAVQKVTPYVDNPFRFATS